MAGVTTWGNCCINKTTELPPNKMVPIYTQFSQSRGGNQASKEKEHREQSAIVIVWLIQFPYLYSGNNHPSQIVRAVMVLCWLDFPGIILYCCLLVQLFVPFTARTTNCNYFIYLHLVCWLLPMLEYKFPEAKPLSVFSCPTQAHTPWRCSTHIRYVSK